MWKLDACVKARVLVDLVFLVTTLKECVRRFCEVPASQWIEQAGNWTCQHGVRCARVRCEINFLLPFETAPLIKVSGTYLFLSEI